MAEIDRLLRLVGWAGLLSSAILLLSIAIVRRLGALLQHNSRLRQRFDPLIAKLLRYL
ncbi:MAG: hypothetical protein HC890_18170 [Chloroflexaceae bacterium]|nr:hypothetical protein [Chloroflexaceae bacterium]